jgi:hypothetical protein
MSFSDLLPIFFIIITIIGAAVQIRYNWRRMTMAQGAEIFLTWSFVVIIGIGGIWGFIGHTLFADQVAESIGWPAGNPFQQEVALANLSMGILGLLSAKITGSFRIATLISYGIFMVGAGIGHVWQIIEAHNMAINNAGPILWIDLIMPGILIGLYVLTLYLKQKEERPSLSW